MPQISLGTNENDLLKAEREEKEENIRLLCKLQDHVPAPPHTTKFQNGKWIINAKQEHQQYLCLQDATKKFADIALVWLDIGCVLHVMETTLLTLKNNLLFEVIKSVF